MTMQTIDFEALLMPIKADLPGPSRTIEINPIEEPLRAPREIPSEPAEEPSEAPAPERRKEEPVPA